MSKESLRNIGIISEGHILEIYHEIQALKLENTRLLNFPPLKVGNHTRRSNFNQNLYKTLFNLSNDLKAEVAHRSRPYRLRSLSDLIYSERIYIKKRLVIK